MMNAQIDSTLNVTILPVNAYLAVATVNAKNLTLTIYAFWDHVEIKGFYYQMLLFLPITNNVCKELAVNTRLQEILLYTLELTQLKLPLTLLPVLQSELLPTMAVLILILTIITIRFLLQSIPTQIPIPNNSNSSNNSLLKPHNRDTTTTVIKYLRHQLYLLKKARTLQL